MSMPQERIWTAALVIIGNEILSGRTKDENLAYLAAWLDRQGIRLSHASVVPDDRDEIGAAINAYRFRHDYVFTTGGIGPTHDDITIAAIAHALGRPLELHPVAEAALRSHYGDRLTDAHLRFARLPRGAEITPSADRTTGGIQVENIIILAGIPTLAQRMLTVFDGKLTGGRPLIARTISIAVAENLAADVMRSVQEAYPDCQIGSYPLWRDGEDGANIVVRSTEPEVLEACVASLILALREIGVDPVDGESPRG